MMIFRAGEKLHTNVPWMQIRQSAAGGPALLISDIFTDADNTILPNHAIAPTNVPGATWLKNVGNNFKISSNKAIISTSQNFCITTLDSLQANCVISVDISTISSPNLPRLFYEAGLVVRYTTINNFWYVYINRGGGNYGIIEQNAGIATIRASANVTISSGVAYTILVVLSGTTISATFAGGSPISYTGATLNQAITRHGLLGTYDNSTWDNFILSA